MHCIASNTGSIQLVLKYLGDFSVIVLLRTVHTFLVCNAHHCCKHFVPNFCIGEEIWETAIRETFEETGVKSEFVSMLCFRHMHGYRWGTDDLYFACLLRPLTTEITINPAEIADAKWMNVSTCILVLSNQCTQVV